MGLDQSWLRSPEPEDQLKNLLMRQENQLVEFFSHRKVPALNAFMTNEWHNRGNIEEFNCKELEVDLALLKDLKAAVKQRTLDEQASGYFWGSHQDGDYKEILDAVKAAKKFLKKGHQVFYYCWY